MRITVGQTVRVAVMAASLIAAGATVATAHHSTAVFDTGTQKTIVGTVNVVEWTNPHIWIKVDVANDKGGVETWAFEGMSPNYLNRRGWSKSTLKPGDKVTIIMNPMRDGTKAGMFVSATRAVDGKVFRMSGA
jgi:hypothetical protein